MAGEATYLKKVILKNIRSHLNTTIELDSGLNVIAGQSDRGKSTIYWAIDWVVSNRSWKPRPWKRLKPGKDSRIELHFSDGNVVTRGVLGGKNYYEVNGEKLMGLTRGTPPDKAVKAMRLSRTNLQPQKEMFFLLDETPGQVARELSKVMELDLMDLALTTASKRVKESKKTVAELDTRVEEKKAVIRKLAWVESAELTMASLLETEEGIKDQEVAVANVVEMAERAQFLKKELSRLPPEELLERIELLGQTAETVDSLSKKIETVAVLVDVCGSLKAELSAFPPEDAQESAGLLNHAAEVVNILSDKVEAVTASISVCSSLTDELDKATIPESIFVTMQGLLAEDRELKTRLANLHNIRSNVIAVAKAKEQFGPPVPSDAFEDAEGLADDHSTVKELESKLFALQEVVNTVDNLMASFQKADVAVLEAADLLNNTRKEIKVCPTCLTVLSRD